MKVLLTALIFISTFSTFSSQATCVVHIKRFACKGQEMESYKKCGGLKECDKVESDALTAEQCAEKARMNCENSRTQITHSKIITAMFDSNSLSSVEGDSDFCLNYPKRDSEFGQCEMSEF